MQWIWLVAAIASEVGGTLALRLAVGGERAWYAAAVSGYLVAFAALTLALDGGLALGVAYGIWTAAGVAVTAIASRLLFEEPLTTLMSAGIGLVIAGVLLVELGSSHQPQGSDAATRPRSAQWDGCSRLAQLANGLESLGELAERGAQR